MNEEQKQIIAGGAIALLVIGFLVTVLTLGYRTGQVENGMKMLAWVCYQDETNMVTEVYGYPAQATYVSDEIAIVVDVYVQRPSYMWGLIGGNMHHQKFDLNKSKIVAHYLGKRFKQAKEGFVAGLKEETKFIPKTGE